MRASLRNVTVVAAILLLLALGLPWSASTLEYVPGWSSPGSCTPNWADGTMDCTSGYTSPGMMVGAAASSGAQTVARVFLVGALVLICLALWRQVATRLLVVAGGVVVLGVLLTGLGAQGGQVAALAAAALLLFAGLTRRTDSDSGLAPSAAPG